MSRNGATAWLCLGGNIGPVRENMCTALQKLESGGEIWLEAVSGLYETPPWGKTDQPPFLNACAAVATQLPVEKLLERCLQAEAALHRERTERWGPRTIDIDILAMDGVEIDQPGLTVPHPRLAQRAFALIPLAELAPDLVIHGTRVEELANNADVTGIVRVAGADEWFSQGAECPSSID